VSRKTRSRAKGEMHTHDPCRVVRMERVILYVKKVMKSSEKLKKNRKN